MQKIFQEVMLGNGFEKRFQYIYPLFCKVYVNHFQIPYYKLNYLFNELYKLEWIEITI